MTVAPRCRAGSVKSIPALCRRSQPKEEMEQALLVRACIMQIVHGGAKLIRESLSRNVGSPIRKTRAPSADEVS